MKSIKPNVQQMEKLNHDLDRKKKEMEKLIQILDDGEKLIRKCSEISCCIYFKKWKYAKKIEEFEETLLKYFQLDMQAQNTVDTRQILFEIKSNKFSISNRGVSDKNENLGSCGAADPPAFMVGLDLPLQELKKRLLKEGKSRIVVSAPGGCGKTTLAKRLCHDPEVKEYFKHIPYVTVSKTFNLIDVIKKLFWHNDEQVPGFQNEEDAVNQLQLLLKKKVESGPLLLVLDDVWCGSESALAKFKFQMSGYNILVTSRSEFPGFETYHLKLLNEEDSRTLFRHSAFPEDGSGSSMHREHLLNKIVRHCKGFPLALEVVGRSLYGQPVEIWRSTLMRLSEGQSILNYEDEMINCLQSSLDAIGGKDIILKECFMDLGSFPEDQKIPVTALIDMWAELHELDEDGTFAISNLQKLRSRNLLNYVITRNDENEIDRWYNDAFATQHDLLRDLAIYQNNQDAIENRKRLILDLTGNRLPEWWTNERQPPLSAYLVSISTGDKMSPSRWPNIHIPEAKVLMLNFNQHSENPYELPELMKQMEKLKVVIVTNYGFCPSELTNFSVLGSLSNLKRIRLEKVSIPMISMELKNLEKLSLVMCRKTSQPFATPEMLPNLREINIGYCNDLVEMAEGFCDLVRLRKLSISNCHRLSALPEEVGKLANLEVLRIRVCTRISKLPGSIGRLQKLSVFDVTGCCRIRNMPTQIGDLRGLRKFQMTGCRCLLELPTSVMNLVDLEWAICDEETAQLWDCFKPTLHNLQLLVLQEVTDLNWL